MGFGRTVTLMVLKLATLLFLTHTYAHAVDYKNFDLTEIKKEKIRLNTISESDNEKAADKADEELEILETFERGLLAKKRSHNYQVGIGKMYFNGKFIVTENSNAESELLSNANSNTASFTYSNESAENYYLIRASFFSGISILNGESLTEAIQASNSGALIKLGAGFFFEDKSTSLGLSIPFLYKKTDVTDTATRTVKALNENAFGLGIDYSWRMTKKYSFDFSMAQIQGLQSFLWDIQLNYHF